MSFEMIGEQMNKVSVLKNPFESDLIEAFHIHGWKDGSVNASIVFKNGNTEGTQKFACGSLNQALEEMKSFISTLK